jgi:hypothetical protein
MFDATAFLRKHSVASKTTVKVHGHTVTLDGMPSTYTTVGTCQLAAAQLAIDADGKGGVRVQTPKVETDDGREIRTRHTLPPAAAAAFIAGDDTHTAKRKGKAEERASAPPAVNGVAS